jgi:CubicO group peptidase (beta-lactamase class C family)
MHRSLTFPITILCLLALSLAVPNARAEDSGERIEDLLQQYHDYDLLNGTALVAREGNVVTARGYGLANMEWDIPNTPDTKFRIGSMTKQFTALIILQLAHEGKLQLEDPITKHVPDYPAESGDKITIHHLLTHTSGIPGYTELPEFWTEMSRDPYEPEEFVEVFSGLELQFEPGTSWTYSNSGYFLLGVIIEKVTGKTYEAALLERVLRPAGMSDSGYDHPRKIIPKRASGYGRSAMAYHHAEYLDMTLPYSAGAMYSTVGDLLKWERALTSDMLLPPEMKDLLVKPHVESGQADYFYGYGVMIRELSIDESGKAVQTVEHGGGINGFSSYLLMIPEDELLIVLLCNAPSELIEITKGIVNLLYDEPAPPPKRPISQLLAEVIGERGVDAALEEYRRLKTEDSGEYRFSEAHLNALAYSFLRQGEIETAVALMELNTQEYPEGFNTHDSLGEGLLAQGDTTRAVQCYQRSLDLNPRNENAKRVLKRLGVTVDENLGEEITLPPEVLDRYVGRYELEPGFILTVTREDSQLMTQATGQPKVPVYPESETKFFLKIVDAQIEFHLDETGKADSLTLYQGGQVLEAARIE